jgi:hypothetical protein
MTEIFRAIDPTNDNRLILHRAQNRFGEPVYTFTISDPTTPPELA